MADNVTISNEPLTNYPAKTTDEDGIHIQHVIAYSALIPKIYDYVSLGYTGNNITTVIYKTGGSGGTTVATLTIGYSGSNIISITRT